MLSALMLYHNNFAKDRDSRGLLFSPDSDICFVHLFASLNAAPCNQKSVISPRYETFAERRNRISLYTSMSQGPDDADHNATAQINVEESRMPKKGRPNASGKENQPDANGEKKNEAGQRKQLEANTELALLLSIHGFLPACATSLTDHSTA